jgi:hypothetical protein
MRTEIHRDAAPYQRAAFAFMIEEGQVGTAHGVRSVRYPNGGSVQVSKLTDIIEPNDIGHLVEQRLAIRPYCIPATFHVEYPPINEALADEVARTITETAKRLGISEFVEVKRQLRPPMPKELYEGQWEAKRDDGQILGLLIEPEGICVLIDGEKRDAATWSMEGENLVIDLGPERFKGTLEAQGHLAMVVEEKKTVSDEQGHPKTSADRKALTFTRVK